MLIFFAEVTEIAVNLIAESPIDCAVVDSFCALEWQPAFAPIVTLAVTFSAEPVLRSLSLIAWEVYVLTIDHPKTR